MCALCVVLCALYAVYTLSCLVMVLICRVTKQDSAAGYDYLHVRVLAGCVISCIIFNYFVCSLDIIVAKLCRYSTN